MIASQLKSPLNEIPPDKIAELLTTKKKLGLPDARLPVEPDSGPDSMEEMADVLLAEDAGLHIEEAPSLKSAEKIEQLVSAITAQVSEFLEKSA